MKQLEAGNWKLVTGNWKLGNNEGTAMVEDTTTTGEAWRDEFCPTCRGNRQHRRDAQGVWRCVYCNTEANPHTARRLNGAESNWRKSYAARGDNPGRG